MLVSSISAFVQPTCVNRLPDEVMADPSLDLVGSRQALFQAWCNAYPNFIALNVSDCFTTLKSPCQDWFQAAALQAVMMAHQGAWQQAAVIFREAHPNSEPEDFILHYFDGVALEFENLRGLLSKVEEVTKHPTWWGDFLSYVIGLDDQNSKLAKVVRIRATLFKHMNLQNIYRMQEGRRRLLLEGECMNWALSLLDTSPLDPKELDFPLRKMFHFSPQEFVPSVLHLAETRKKASSTSTTDLPFHKRWFAPLITLPAFFSYSSDPQNFDKRPLLTSCRDWIKETSQPELSLISLLGLSLTWSPNIHEFASLKDQKKIELFYLSSKLDSGSAVYHLPLELFRKILEENFFLGNRHKTQCDDCRGQKTIHGWNIENRNCCTCECFKNFTDEKKPRSVQFCFGLDPFVDCWGESWGVCHKILEEK